MVGKTRHLQNMLSFWLIRIAGLPKQMFIADIECSESEFSFIETKPAVKKTAKGTKAKKAVKDKPNTKPDRREHKKTNDVESKVHAPPNREMSPVSMLIQDMVKKQAEQLEQLPVARRTRASLGKRDASPKQTPTAIKPPAATQPKRITRGRKKKTTDAATVEQEIVDLVKDYKTPVLEAYVRTWTWAFHRSQTNTKFYTD